MATKYAKILDKQKAERVVLSVKAVNLPKPDADGEWEWSVSGRRTFLLVRTYQRMRHPFGLLCEPVIAGDKVSAAVAADSEWVWLDDDDITDTQSAARRICDLAVERVEHERG